MHATTLLTTAADTIGGRAAQRDSESERSMARAIRSFNAMFGHRLTEREGWLFMSLLKISRSQSNPDAVNPDDYIDGAAYFALAGECAMAGGGEKELLPSPADTPAPHGVNFVEVKLPWRGVARFPVPLSLEMIHQIMGRATLLEDEDVPRVNVSIPESFNSPAHLAGIRFKRSEAIAIFRAALEFMAAREASRKSPPVPDSTDSDPLNLAEILAPVMDWYQSDEQPPRPLADILREVVADLQRDRAAAISGAADTRRLDFFNAHPRPAQVHGGPDDGRESNVWAIASAEPDLRQALDCWMAASAEPRSDGSVQSD